MINKYIKFEFLSSTHYEDRNKEMVLGGSELDIFTYPLQLRILSSWNVVNL